MEGFWQGMGRAVRRWPFYTGLMALLVVGFGYAGLTGYRLLGDDNESDANELVGPPRAGGHGGYVRGFNHK
jgi:hypothetical protein